MSLPPLLEEIYATGAVEDADGGRLSAFPESLPRAHAEELVRLVRELGARRTLETGMAYGISTLAIASALATDDARHIAVDPHQRDSWRGIGLLNVARAGLEDRVELIEQPSELALPRLVASRAELDLVLIDGLHLFDHTLVDFFYADRLLRVGGVVVFHDTWMPAVRQAASYVLANRAYERLDAGDDAMWALRKLGGDDRAWDFHRDFAGARGGPRRLSRVRSWRRSPGPSGA